MLRAVTEVDVLAAMARGQAGERDERGDSPARQALAEFVLQHRERIRAIARQKLPGGARSVFDSEEVVSSVLRRLDGMASRGTLAPRSPAELWGLITAIATNAAVDRRRLIERARSHLAEDGPYAYELLKRLNACESDDDATMLLLRMMMSIKNSTDRHVFMMLHRGASHRAIATALGISEAASRKRWSVLRQELAERFREGHLDV